VHPGTVLLHLYAAALAKRTISPSIPALYIPVLSPFPALEAFIIHAARLYKLPVLTCTPPSAATTSAEAVTPDGEASTDGTNMRKALELYRVHCPLVKAILIGTRRTDPHGGAHSTFVFNQPLYLLTGVQQHWTSVCRLILTGHLLFAYTQSLIGGMRKSGHSFGGSKYHIVLCMTKGLSVLRPLFVSNPFVCQVHLPWLHLQHFPESCATCYW
jgi:hypothetical protein